jgi:hypothetical protein
LEDMHHSVDCQSEHADPIKTFTNYHVVVHCGSQTYNYTVHTKTTTRGCRATHIIADN